MGREEEIVSLSLGSASLVLLSLALLLKIVDPNNRCGPVFLNFVLTWILWSARLVIEGIFHLMSSKDTPAGSNDGSDKVREGVRNMLWVATQIATLNVILYLTMGLVRGLKQQPMSPRRSKWTLLLLLATPYLFALLPIGIFFAPEEVLASRSFEITLGILYLALVIITILLDINLLMIFYKHRTLLRETDLEASSLYFKLIVLCTFRVIFAGVFTFRLVDIGNQLSKSINEILDSVYPFCVFLISIQPSWFARTRTSDNVSEDSASTIGRTDSLNTDVILISGPQKPTPSQIEV